MLSIERSALPPKSMLEIYSKNGAYVDCFQTDVPAPVTLREYVYAFYTTPLFRLERAILTISVSKPSSDEQAMQLADGARDSFAAWSVESRSENEILMCDFVARTRSWLKVVSINGTHTRLFFGSVVVPTLDSRTGRPSIGLVYRGLLGFHQIYSVLLLYSARWRIQRQLSGVRKATI